MKGPHFHLSVHNLGQLGPLHVDLLQDGQKDTSEDSYLWEYQ